MSEPAEVAAMTSTPEEALRSARLILPPVRELDRAQIRRVGSMLYTPGILPCWGDELRYSGRVDVDLPLRMAVRAAQLCIHNLVSLVRAELGTLDDVLHVMQLSVLVNRDDDFENLTRVADGASAALFQLFGPRGRHRREVLGTPELPGGAAVQVSAVLRVTG
ncbi:MAG: RidA family protein [Candidatus Dormibacteria bacterium]